MTVVSRKLVYILWRSVKLLLIFVVIFLLLSFLMRQPTSNSSNNVEKYAQKYDHHHPKVSIYYNSTRRNQPENAKIYPNYYEDNLHPKWTFKISRYYDERLLRRWSEPMHVVNKTKLWSQGENGTGFSPSNELDRAEKETLKKVHQYDIFGSERISLHRRLPDLRVKECRNLVYPEKLPTTSIIIIFHNEAWSMLLRTIWSIIDRSPRELIHEIILVDDVSTWPFLKRPLDDYFDLLPVDVKIIRTSKREGLIRARVIGAKIATGSVLTFLDAHMECTDGWLQPILARIASDRSVVAVPVIDFISDFNMTYYPRPAEIYGLHWSLLFYWMNIPERELKRTKYDKTAPLRTPTHVGCAFSIDREYFFEIGTYDEQMEIWGSENVELAFRVWMCGGSLEVLPCSHVGHLYRTSIYSFNGDKEKTKARNNNRLIEVWVDEFKEFYHGYFPMSRNVSAGDITERKKLRKQLKCKSFRWYLENIYPESTMLKEYIVLGQITSVSTDDCLDAFPLMLNNPIVLYTCHVFGGFQFIGFTKSGHIAVSVHDYCLGGYNRSIILVECSEMDKSQLWKYDKENQLIIHRESHLCMQANEKFTSVILGTCDSEDEQFQWEIKSTVSTK